MRRAVQGLIVAMAFGLTMLTSAEAASAVTFVTGLYGTAEISGPVSYSWQECWKVNQYSWDCTDWTDVNTSGTSWISMEISCFFICFGSVDLRIDHETGPPFVPQGSPYVLSFLFIGSATASGDVITVGGTSIALGGPKISQLLQVFSPRVTMSFATGAATVTWPQPQERCGFSGEVCRRFRANPQASGTLVSGGINVSGF